MKKVILCLIAAATGVVTLQLATAKEPTTNAALAATPADLDKYIHQVYTEIDFKGSEKISFEAFAAAMKGYLNLRNAGKLDNSRQVLSVADFTLSSTRHRLWIIDLAKKKVLMNDFVAHGQGSGDEFATAFSNTENSHQSSIGFYVTGDTYEGQHGNSLRLYGMDNGFNSAAFDRAIVVHGADYVSPSFIAGQRRLGRSWGCPAVSNQAIGKVIDYIKGGTCMFLYYPQKNYVAQSFWLNKKVERLPEEIMLKDLNMPLAQAPVKYVYDQSAQDLNPESPEYLSPEARVKKQKLMAMDLRFVRRVMP